MRAPVSYPSDPQQLGPDRFLLADYAHPGAALIMSRTGSAKALAFLRAVRTPPNEIVTSDADLEARAEERWLAKYDDHALSLTDGVSFEVMRERRIREVLTLDDHFAVAGFTIV